MRWAGVVRVRSGAPGCHALISCRHRRRRCRHHRRPLPFLCAAGDRDLWRRTRVAQRRGLCRTRVCPRAGISSACTGTHAPSARRAPQNVPVVSQDLIFGAALRQGMSGLDGYGIAAFPGDRATVLIAVRAWVLNCVSIDFSIGYIFTCAEKHPRIVVGPAEAGLRGTVGPEARARAEGTVRANAIITHLMLGLDDRDECESVAKASHKTAKLTCAGK